MEHDIEQLIREKIMTAESSPQAWKKEAVWCKVRDTLKPARKRVPAYYYAAACGAVIVMSLFYLQWDTEREVRRRYKARTKLERITPSESITGGEEQGARGGERGVRSKERGVRSKEQGARSKNGNPMVVPRASRDKEEKYSQGEVTPEVNIPEEHSQGPIPLIAEAAVVRSSPDSISVKETVVAKRKVYPSPIIGVFETPRESPPAAQRLKVTIPLFTPSGKEHPELQKPSDQSLVARIN